MPANPATHTTGRYSPAALCGPVEEAPAAGEGSPGGALLHTSCRWGGPPLPRLRLVPGHLSLLADGTGGSWEGLPHQVRKFS